MSQVPLYLGQSGNGVGLGARGYPIIRTRTKPETPNSKTLGPKLQTQDSGCIGVQTRYLGQSGDTTTLKSCPSLPRRYFWAHEMLCRSWNVLVRGLQRCGPGRAARRDHPYSHQTPTSNTLGSKVQTQDVGCVGVEGLEFRV